MNQHMLERANNRSSSECIEKKVFFFCSRGIAHWLGRPLLLFFCLFQRWYNQKMAYYTYYYHRVHIYSSSSIETDCIRTVNGYTTAFSTLIIPLHEKKERQGRKTHQLLCICCGEPKMTQGTRRYKIGYYYYSPREQWLVSNETPPYKKKKQKRVGQSRVYSFLRHSLSAADDPIVTTWTVIL